MSNPIKWLFLLASSLIISPVFAVNSLTVNCPEQIETQQTTVSAPAGWRVLNADTRHYWSGVTLYSGKPEDNASLKPENKKNKRTWNFSASEEIYAVCEYNQTNLQLTQKLPAHTTDCNLTLDMNSIGPFGPAPKQLLCKTAK